MSNRLQLRQLVILGEDSHSELLCHFKAQMSLLSFRIMLWRDEKSATSVAHTSKISRLRLEMTILGQPPRQAITPRRDCAAGTVDSHGCPWWTDKMQIDVAAAFLGNTLIDNVNDEMNDSGINPQLLTVLTCSDTHRR